MADDKKKEGGGGGNMLWEMIGGLIGLALLFMAVERGVNYLAGTSLGSPAMIWTRISDYFVYNWWPVIKIFSALISLGFVIGVFYNFSKLNKIQEEEKEIYGSRKKDLPLDEDFSLKNEKWERIIELLNSPNSSDWRLAIIEADIMLEDVMRRAGYHGDTLGEMLKSVEKSDMLTLDNAWEAHKIRNAIAHRGADYQLNSREAGHAIAEFEKVFREFKII